MRRKGSSRGRRQPLLAILLITPSVTLGVLSMERTTSKMILGKRPDLSAALLLLAPLGPKEGAGPRHDAHEALWAGAGGDDSAAAAEGRGREPRLGRRSARNRPGRSRAGHARRGSGRGRSKTNTHSIGAIPSKPRAGPPIFTSRLQAPHQLCDLAQLPLESPLRAPTELALCAELHERIDQSVERHSDAYTGLNSATEGVVKRRVSGVERAT